MAKKKAKKQKTIFEVTKKGTRREQLETLAEKLAIQLDACDDVKIYPQLARQYRATLEALDLIPEESDDDPIAQIQQELGS